MRKYDSISNDVRHALIMLTQNNGLSISKACKILKMKTSCGKSIIRRSRVRGTYRRLNNQ